MATERLASWLPGGAIELKRRDAAAALDLALAVASNPPVGVPAMPPRTLFLERLAAHVGVTL